MKEPNLQIITFLSLVVHAALLVVALIAIKQAHRFTPSAYIVNLIGSDTGEGIGAAPASTAEPEIKEKPGFMPESKKAVRTKENAKEYAADRIEAMKAKRKIKDVVKLRGVISIGGSGSSQTETDEAEPAQPAAGDLSSDAILNSYAAGIQRRIEQRWAFPTTWGKNLQTIISVMVMSDGTAKINRIEKSSGNIFFDRSVINAIYKASPFPPPPYEMEIELNFQPKGKN